MKPKILKPDKMYGTTTLGARGQVVIPAQARKDLKLKPGDRLLVMGRMDKAVGLIKVDEVQDFVEMMMEGLTGGKIEGLNKKLTKKGNK